MCGRFSLFATPEEVSGVFSVSLAEAADVVGSPRFNVAPTQSVAVVRRKEASDQWEADLLRWGLVPHWSKELGTGPLLINARAETINQKPAFRSSFRARRCLVPANGFYEWQKTPAGKRPYHFQVDDGALFAFAGIWDRWNCKELGPLESCAIITTTANELTGFVHHRMPVILDQNSWGIWLSQDQDASPQNDTLMSLLRPFSAERMSAVPVSNVVNSPRNDGQECIAPIGPAVQAERDSS